MTGNIVLSDLISYLQEITDADDWLIDWLIDWHIKQRVKATVYTLIAQASIHSSIYIFELIGLFIHSIIHSLTHSLIKQQETSYHTATPQINKQTKQNKKHPLLPRSGLFQHRLQSKNPFLFQHRLSKSRTGFRCQEQAACMLMCTRRVSDINNRNTLFLKDWLLISALVASCTMADLSIDLHACLSACKFC